MAGHNKPVLHMDPAYVKYANMYVNRYKHFRWTKRTAGISFAYMVVVPAIFGVMAYSTDGKWDMRGKRRGDLISEF